MVSGRCFAFLQYFKGVKKCMAQKERERMKFKVRVFVGDVEITDENRHKYVIRNNTVDRIVNAVWDRAIIVDNEDGEKMAIVKIYEPTPTEKKRKNCEEV